MTCLLVFRENLAVKPRQESFFHNHRGRGNVQHELLGQGKQGR